MKHRNRACFNIVELVKNIKGKVGGGVGYWLKISNCNIGRFHVTRYCRLQTGHRATSYNNIFFQSN